MGKKNNNQPAPKNEQTNNNENQPAVQVIQTGDFMKQLDPANMPNKNLSPDSMATVLGLIDKKFGGDPEAAAAKYKMSVDSVKTLDIVATHSLVALFATCIIEGNDSIAMNVKRACLPEIKKVAEDMGITFGEPLLLAPVKDGEEHDSDIVQIQGNDTKISPDAKKQIKEDAKIANQEIELDPTKLDKDGAVKAVEHILVKTTGGYEKLYNAIVFYRSWLEVQNKDNKEELEKVKNLSDLEILDTIKKEVKRCPFVVNSMGKHMGTMVAIQKSPIFAFCMFRNSTKNKTTGTPKLSDQEIADYTRFIVNWALEIKVEDYKKALETKKNDIAELSKTKKAKEQNAKGITKLEEEIAKIEENIAHCNETMNYIVNPSSEIPDTLIDEYKKHESWANNIIKMIWQSYYSDFDITKVAPEVVYNNVQQHAGMITSMFRDAGSPLQDYNESKLMEVVVTEEPEDSASESEKSSESEKKEEKN